jgi:hypothetical protein
MTWQEEAVNLRGRGKTFAEIRKILRDKYGEDFHEERIRGMYRRTQNHVETEPPDRNPIPDDKVINHVTKAKRIRFGLISDTHLCSKKQQLTHLNDYYDECADRGIERVYHSGDVLAGDKVYQGQTYEVFKHGFDEQLDYTVDNYPKRRGIKTSFITGNHDLDFFKHGGADIGPKIAEKRDDTEYCGKLSAIVNLAPQVSLQLLHMDGGVPYALTYKSQRIVDGLPGGEKPKIISFGHDHQRAYFFRRNVHALHAGCFEGQTFLLKRKGIMPEIGGWFCEIEVDGDGSVVAFRPEARVWFKEIPNDY